MMEMINLGEDEPDVFYDCYEEVYDASLQSVADNFYHHVDDGKCFAHHEHIHSAGQIIISHLYDKGRKWVVVDQFVIKFEIFNI